MKKLFASKEVKAAIRKAMSNSQRRWLDEGEIFSVRIVRSGKTLIRWGEDEKENMENVAVLKIQGRNCRILDTNLKDRAWSYDSEKAFEEGVRALNYYVYGPRHEYKIFIGGEEGKGNHKTHYYVRGYYGPYYQEGFVDNYKHARKIASSLREPGYGIPKITVVK